MNYHQYFYLLFLFTFFTCKENDVVKDHNNADVLEQTFEFDLAREIIPYNEAIEKIEAIEIKSNDLIYLSQPPFSKIICNNDDFIVSTTYDNLNLFTFQNSGEVYSRIVANQSNISSPKLITSFDFSNDQKSLYVLDRLQSKIFHYDLKGLLKKVYTINSSAYKLLTISDSTCFLQAFPIDAAIKGTVEPNYIGSIYNYNTGSETKVYINEGSVVRNRHLGLGAYYTNNNNVLYNYPYSRNIYIIDNKSVIQIIKLNSKDFVDTLLIQKLDSRKYGEENEISNVIFNTEKIAYINFIYMNEDIYFFVFGHERKLKWLFYNAKINQYKVIEFKYQDTIEINGLVFKPYIQNANKNYLLYFLDGELLLKESNTIKINKNSNYIVKIYPKYLNPEAWE